MQPGISNTARLHHRHELALPVRFDILPEHAAQVAYAPGSLAREHQSDLIDIGPTGLAFITHAFVPRMARILVRLYELGNDGGVPILAGAARVHRVCMTDSRPGYLIGTSFMERSLAFTRDIHLLIARAEGSRDPVRHPPHRGGHP